LCELRRRYAFGGPSHALRHGRLHDVGEREQTFMGLLSLVTWLDGKGWRRLTPSSQP